MALEGLLEANRLDPEDIDIQVLLDECLKRIQKRKERKRLEDKKRNAIEDKKLQVNLQIIRDRKAKGDLSFRDRDFQRAMNWYDRAYRKYEYNYGYGNSLYIFNTLRHEPAADLLLDLLSQLIAVSLEIGDNWGVHWWANVFFNGVGISFTVDGRISMLGYEWTEGSEDSARKAYHTTCYCKAMVCQRKGRVGAAIKNFERALLADPSCHACYYMLENAKQVEHEMKDKAEELGLNL